MLAKLNELLSPDVICERVVEILSQKEKEYILIYQGIERSESVSYKLFVDGNEITKPLDAKYYFKELLSKLKKEINTVRKADHLMLCKEIEVIISKIVLYSPSLAYIDQVDDVEEAFYAESKGVYITSAFDYSALTQQLGTSWSAKSKMSLYFKYLKDIYSLLLSYEPTFKADKPIENNWKGHSLNYSDNINILRDLVPTYFEEGDIKPFYDLLNDNGIDRIIKFKGAGNELRAFLDGIKSNDSFLTKNHIKHFKNNLMVYSKKKSKYQVIADTPSFHKNPYDPDKPRIKMLLEVAGKLK